MRYEVSTDIDAPVELIWRLTTEIDDWPAFLPTVHWLRRLDEGELRVGSSARIKQPGQLSAVWTVTRLDPLREFTWETGRAGLRLIGSHLLDTAGAGTRLTLALETAGPAAGVVSALFGGMMRGSISRETEGFARQAVAVR
ncbi:SRPBCC family protein [Actinoplanes sp. NPDC026619]|uniref:SRPBCC family protein n=1 Tax=Actinoplanes sp. NPDC026619 TaxID=3155798 RepID=UPI0034103802